MPETDVAYQCTARRPDLIVGGSLNGHGYADGMRLIRVLRAEPALAATPVVIGGKLDVAGGASGAAARLLAAGYDAVYEDTGGLRPFRSLVHALAARTGEPIGCR